MWSDVPCKLWTGGTVRGYGQTTRTVNGVRTAWLVHRLAWVEINGPVPLETPFVLHHCDTPACYEVTHLWLGTHADNMADMKAKGRGRSVAAETNRVKTHCKHGHEFTPEDTHVRANGRRVCLACNRERCRRYSKVRATKRPSRAKR